MDFSWGPELEQFRNDVRAFISDFVTPEMAADLAMQSEDGPTANTRTFNDELDRRGWRKASLPVEYGGGGKSPLYSFICNEVLSYAFGTATTDLNITSIAPAIARFGTEEQKNKLMPMIWEGQATFAIGYSEPNAGTDVARLECAATRDGDEWVINGQKIWTTAAHVSTHIWLAARTDPDAPLHKGISFFMVPLNAPGVLVRPIPTMAYMRTNEVFFEDVRVPADALVGKLNGGWYIMMNALNHERHTIGFYAAQVAQFHQLVDYLKEHKPEALKDPAVIRQLAEAKVELFGQIRALKMTVASMLANDLTPEAEASMAKVFAAEFMFRNSNTSINLMGRWGALTKDDPQAPLAGLTAYNYFQSDILRFGGGTNDIQRGIIAQRGLGLPRK